MSNVAGKAYGMTLLNPMKPRKTWVNRFTLLSSRGMPETLAGLLGLSIIHFARWVIIKRDQWPDLGQGRQTLANDYMLFISNFNGTWDQYIDAFMTAIPNGLNLLWISATKWPQSIPMTPFKDWIRHNQITTDYYYNATPGAAQRDIKCALRVASAVRRLAAQHARATPAQFAAAYKSALLSIQNDLGSPGYAPIASNDTDHADTYREPFVKARWAGSSGAADPVHAEL